MPKVSKKPTAKEKKRRGRNTVTQKIALSDLTSTNFTEATFEMFLANYSGHMSTDKACEAAGTTRWSLARWLRKNPDRIDEMKRAIEVPILTQIRDSIATASQVSKSPMRRHAMNQN